MSQHALPATYILSNSQSTKGAIMEPEQSKWPESGQLHTRQHIRSLASEGQRGMTGVAKSFGRLMRLSFRSRTRLYLVQARTLSSERAAKRDVRLEGALPLEKKRQCGFNIATKLLLFHNNCNKSLIIMSTR